MKRFLFLFVVSASLSASADMRPIAPSKLNAFKEAEVAADTKGSCGGYRTSHIYRHADMITRAFRGYVSDGTQPVLSFDYSDMLPNP